VMCGGRIVGELAAAEADERSLGLMMADARQLPANEIPPPEPDDPGETLVAP